MNTKINKILKKYFDRDSAVYVSHNGVMNESGFKEFLIDIFSLASKTNDVKYVDTSGDYFLGIFDMVTLLSNNINLTTEELETKTTSMMISGRIITFSVHKLTGCRYATSIRLHEDRESVVVKYKDEEILKIIEDIYYNIDDNTKCWMLLKGLDLKEMLTI